MPCSHVFRDGGVDRAGHQRHTDVMSDAEIDAYLASLPELQRNTLAELRRTILTIVPECEQCLSYGIPAFRMRGKVIAGFAAFRNHLSYFPHSGSVLPQLRKDVAKYSTSKGTLRFPSDRPLPPALVKKLLHIRLQQAFHGDLLDD
jgi:uncharacterized protein YdhG (YjbR/CyaY superfamily)